MNTAEATMTGAVNWTGEWGEMKEANKAKKGRQPILKAGAQPLRGCERGRGEVGVHRLIIAQATIFFHPAF